MLNKFFPHGTGIGKEPIDYLLGEDRNRPGATILRGDPDLTEQLINTAPGRYRYTSGALSFAEHIDDATAERIIDEYERFFSADGAAEINILWVKHTDKGRTELHFLIPNVELATGRAYYPYVHTLDERTIDALKDKINAEYDLADPNDPARKRLTASAADYLKQTKDRKSLLAVIDDHITQLAAAHIARGNVWTRENTIQALQELGLSIERRSDKFLSVGHPDLKKNLRLKGWYYESDCRIDHRHAHKIAQASERYRAERHERAQIAANRYEELLRKRHQRIANRYRNDKAAQKTLGAHPPEPAETTPLPAPTDRHEPPDETPLPCPTPEPRPKPTRIATNPKKQKRAAWNPVHRHPKRQTPQTDPPDRGRPLESPHAPISIPIYFHGRLIGMLIDHGDLIEAQQMSAKAAAFNLVKRALEKGWQQIQFKGSDTFLYHAMRIALDRGLKVIPTDEHQKKILAKVEQEKAEDDRARATLDANLDRAKQASRRLGAASRHLGTASRTLDETLERTRRTYDRLEQTGGQLRRATEHLDRLARAVERIKTQRHRDADNDYDGPSF